jgi:integrase
MEAKPRVKYSECFVVRKTVNQFEIGTVAWFIQRKMDDSEKPGARRMGKSQFYLLRNVQRAPIGGKKAVELKVADLIEHCRARKSGAERKAVKPPTIMQDIVYLRGVIRESVEVDDLPPEALLVFMKAKRRLEKEQLIGKSALRDRLPTPEEIAALMNFFSAQNNRKSTKTPMDLITQATLWTGRRISELCRITRADVDVAKRTCWVRDLKNPKGKGEHAEFALLGRAWDIFEERLRVIPNHPQARLFPYNPKTCSARYTLAKKALGIQGLRMHDNRAECFTKLLEKGYSIAQVQKGVSLHKDPKMLIARYTRIKAADLHRGPAGQQPQPSP